MNAYLIGPNPECQHHIPVEPVAGSTIRGINCPECGKDYPFTNNELQEDCEYEYGVWSSATAVQPLLNSKEALEASTGRFVWRKRGTNEWKSMAGLRWK